MNIFEYLRDDEAHIERRLKDITAHGFSWPQEQLFEESVRLFTAVTNHLEKKETILTRYLSSLDAEMEGTLRDATKHRYDIEAQIESLTQMHIDENDFVESMESLLRKVINHRKFCEDHFYPQIEAHLSKAERKIIDEKFEDLVFS
ncbi:MAG: hypothetical protein K2X27_10250 [Candidatus Obscuribacterales bacterium]|nr:hypothetical protein [Candidatus Obscuribacterales bacterium]